MGWTLLGIVWGVAVVGVVFKAFFVKRFLYISTILYIAMGWLIVIAWGLCSYVTCWRHSIAYCGRITVYIWSSVLRMASISISSCCLAYFCISWFGCTLFCCVILCYSALKQVFYKICFLC